MLAEFDIFEKMEREMELFRKRMMKEFEEAFKTRTKRPISVPSVDVSEKKGKIGIVLDLPGVRKEEIELIVTENTIEVRAEQRKEIKERGKTFYRRERSYTGYHRALPLPARVDVNSIRTRFEDGVLRISLKKKKSEKAKKKLKVKVK